MISLLCLVNEDLIYMIYYPLLFIVPTPELLQYTPFDVNKLYSGMALIYECVFEVDLQDDPDAKPVTVWKKNEIEITSDDRLNVISPMKQRGSDMTFRAKLKFKYLIADKDEGNYTCDNFVNSSADSEFIEKGNSSRESFSLSVKGTLFTVMQKYS